MTSTTQLPPIEESWTPGISRYNSNLLPPMKESRTPGIPRHDSKLTNIRIWVHNLGFDKSVNQARFEFLTKLGGSEKIKSQMRSLITKKSIAQEFPESAEIALSSVQSTTPSTNAHQWTPQGLSEKTTEDTFSEYSTK